MKRSTIWLRSQRQRDKLDINSATLVIEWNGALGATQASRSAAIKKRKCFFFHPHSMMTCLYSVSDWLWPWHFFNHLTLTPTKHWTLTGQSEVSGFFLQNAGGGGGTSSFLATRSLPSKCKWGTLCLSLLCNVPSFTQKKWWVLKLSFVVYHFTSFHGFKCFCCSFCQLSNLKLCIFYSTY